MTTWFGNADGSGGLVSWPSDYTWGQAFPAPASGNITAARAMVKGGSTFALTKVLVYAVSGGAPAALLGASDQVTIPGSDPVGLRNYTFSTPVAVVSGTSYFLMMFVGNTSIEIQKKDAGTLFYRSTPGAYPTPANPFGSPSTVAGFQNYLEAGIDTPAPAFRAAGTLAATSGGPVVISYPAGVASGDLLVVQYMGTAAGTPTPSGWTLLFGPITEASGWRSYGFYRVAGGSEPSTVSFVPTSSGNGFGIMTAYTGADATTPINASATAAVAGSSTAGQTPSVTTTVANTLLLRMLYGWGGASVTPPGTDTERYDVLEGTLSGYVLYGATSSQAAAGASGTTTATFGSSLFGGGGRAATLAVAPGTAPPPAPASGFLGFM